MHKQIAVMYAAAALLAATAGAAAVHAQQTAPPGIPLGSLLQAGPTGYNLAQPEVPVSAYRPPTWHVFLVAADRAEPVFDNAVARLGQLFESRYGIKAERFSARALPRPGTRSATLAEIRAAGLARRIGPNDACLFYFTTHGEIRGIGMAAQRSLVGPPAIDALIEELCGARPTVLVVSACHSGVFMQPALARSHRIMLAAARADRSSFGCSFREDLSFYDRCFIESWDAAATWQTLHAAIASCVHATETARRFRPPSLPQAFFGRQMRDLPLTLVGRRNRAWRTGFPPLMVGRLPATLVPFGRHSQA